MTKNTKLTFQYEKINICQNYNKAFTLIELLVTIAIVTILANVSIAIFEQYRTKAYNTETLATQRVLIQIAHAIENEIEEATIIRAQGASSYCYKPTNSVPMCGEYNARLSQTFQTLLPDKLKNNNEFFYYAEVTRHPAGINSQVDIFHCRGDISTSWRSQNGVITEYRWTKTEMYGHWRDWCPGFYNT